MLIRVAIDRTHDKPGTYPTIEMEGIELVKPAASTDPQDHGSDKPEYGTTLWITGFTIDEPSSDNPYADAVASGRKAAQLREKLEGLNKRPVRDVLRHYSLADTTICCKIYNTSDLALAAVEADVKEVLGVDDVTFEYETVTNRPTSK